MSAWKRSLGLLAVTVAACSHGGTRVETTPSPGMTGVAVEALPDGRIPAGSVMWMELSDEIDEDQRAGDPFLGSIVRAVIDREGQVLVPAGTPVRGRVIEVHGASRKEPASVRLGVESMELAGHEVPLVGHVVETEVPGHRPSKAKGAIAGGAAGALVGGILGGGKGVLVGGLLGAGGGTLIAAGMGRNPELPRGTRLAVQMDKPTASLASFRRSRVY